MPARPNWIDLVPTNQDAYVYQAALLCTDCAKKLIESLPPDDVDDGNSDYYPQGPYPCGGGEADSPQHCSALNCKNAVQIPGGRRVGCPLGNPLTKDGDRYTTTSIAKSILSKSRHERAVGRLWLHIYDYLEPAELIELTADDPQSSPAKRLLPKHYRPVPDSSLYTDLHHLYGAAASPRQSGVVLWRLSIDDVGEFFVIRTVELPGEELSERTVEDMLKEAWRDDAWE